MEGSNRFIYDMIICMAIGSLTILLLILIGVYIRGGEITISPTFMGEDFWIFEWTLDLIVVIGFLMFIIIGGIKVYYNRIK
jgi:hypothetical protein